MPTNDRSNCDITMIGMTMGSVYYNITHIIDTDSIILQRAQKKKKIPNL